MSKQSIIFINTLLLYSANLSAQIATDGSLGPKMNLPGPNYQIGAELGQQHGGNLFHSFETFNLNTHENIIESATFSARFDSGIQNVISRVTGENPSRIDGLIRSTIPNADFYFLNPHGIMFESNARLDVQGSFHASTANSIRFEDGSSFSATNNVSNPILTVASPKAFGFLDTPAPLSLNNSFLELKENQTLSLIGGPLTITNSTLFVPDGNINLVGMNELQMIDSTVYAPAGRIGLFATALQNVIPNSFETLVESLFIKSGTINISDNLIERTWIFSNHIQSSPALREKLSQRPPISDYVANIDTNGEGGGQVVIRAGQLFLDGGSIYADNEYGSMDGNGIDIKIKGDMRLTNSARITAGAMEELEENVRGGDISIQAGKLEMSGLDTNQLIPSIMQRFTPEYLQKNLDMDEQEATDFLNHLQTVVFKLLEQGSEISLDIIVSKVDEQYTTFIPQFPQLFTPIFNTIGTKNFGIGNGGNIQINAPILTMDNSSLIEADTLLKGQAGNIEINAQNISLNNFAFIYATTTGFGKAGDITIQGINQQEVANRLSVTNMSSITASSENTLSSDKLDSHDLSDLHNGDAGKIDINTHQIVLENGGFINSFSDDGIGKAGKAGTINIETDTALFTGEGSGIYTNSDTGGGDIFLTVDNRLELFDNSKLTAEAFGDTPQDKGGNITITNPATFTLENSQLLANAYAGNGGKIDINTSEFNVLGDSQIDVSSALGYNEGEFRLNKVKLREEFLVLRPPTLLETELSLSRCAGLSREDLSSFFMIIRDVPPEAPGDLQTDLYISE